MQASPDSKLLKLGYTGKILMPVAKRDLLVLLAETWANVINVKQRTIVYQAHLFFFIFFFYMPLWNGPCAVFYTTQSAFRKLTLNAFSKHPQRNAQYWHQTRSLTITISSALSAQLSYSVAIHLDKKIRFAQFWNCSSCNHYNWLLVFVSPAQVIFRLLLMKRSTRLDVILTIFRASEKSYPTI